LLCIIRCNERSARLTHLQRPSIVLLLYQLFLTSVRLGLSSTCCNSYVSDAEGLVVPAYGSWFKALAARNQSWQDYLLKFNDDNPFHRQSFNKKTRNCRRLVAAAQQDYLQALQSLYKCSGDF